jgi:hypothetical protein
MNKCLALLEKRQTTAANARAPHNQREIKAELPKLKEPQAAEPAVQERPDTSPATTSQSRTNLVKGPATRGGATVIHRREHRSAKP